MEGQTVRRGFDEHETVENTLQDNDHKDIMNTVLGKQYTMEAQRITNRQAVLQSFSITEC